MIIPVGITNQLTAEGKKNLYDAAAKYEGELKKAGVRVKVDYRENYTPGWKFNHWEVKGVPVRLELGPKDLEKGAVVACRRDTLEKTSLALATLPAEVDGLLERIQAAMYAKAKKERDEHLKIVYKWDEFVPVLNSKNIVMIPWCQQTPCEDDIKDRSAKASAEAVDEKAPSMGAKTLCIPFEQPGDATQHTCVGCGKPAKSFTLFGRSY